MRRDQRWGSFTSVLKIFIHFTIFQFKYTYGGAENPVGNAVLANLKGKFTKPDKPKVNVNLYYVCVILCITVSLHGVIFSMFNRTKIMLR